MKHKLIISTILLFSLTIVSCGEKDDSTNSDDTTAPVIAEVTSVTTPTTDTTPNYTFSSDEAGTITYGGSCSSSTTSAISGNNTITFNALNKGTYSNCTIIVKDSTGNASNTLEITSFVLLPSYVAVGQLSKIVTSSDGTTWDNRSSGTTSNLIGITHGNNKFLAIAGTTIDSNGGTVLTSSNGTSWTSSSVTCSSCPSDNSSFYLNDVTFFEQTLNTNL